MAALRYGGGRPIIFTLLFAVVYFVVLPGTWPEPSVHASVPSTVVLGEDLQVEVEVKAWHANFQVRQISFAVSNVSSTALVHGNKPFIPLNLLEEKKVEQWQVGFVKRVTWPRTRSFRLTVPLRKLALQRLLREGELNGTIDVVADHTRVTTSGYPPLTATSRVPYSLTVGR